MPCVLEELRDQIPSVKAAGFVSEQFQRWHGAVIGALRQVCGEAGNEYRDFQALQFELLPEIEDTFVASLQQIKDEQAPHKRRGEMQSRHFLQAMGEAADLLTAAIVACRK